MVPGGENATGQPENTKKTRKNKDYDDRFYDLDDGFIDDEDMED